MKGKILDYNVEKNEGMISGNDGKRYKFTISEWKSNKEPIAGRKVDFDIDGEFAKEIYLDNSGVTFNIDVLKSNGSPNKLGIILSILTAISLFLPIIKVPFLGINVALLDGFIGKILFVLYLLLAYLFYLGVEEKIIQIGIVIIDIIVFFQFYQIFSSLNSTGNMMGMFIGENINLFKFLSIWAYVIIVLNIVLTFIGFKKNK